LIHSTVPWIPQFIKTAREFWLAEVPSQLRRLGGGIGVIALAPFLIAAMTALVLMFLAKLVFALVAVGFESSQRDQTAQITHTKSRRPVKKEPL
jgi:hypothetical protein